MAVRKDRVGKNQIWWLDEGPGSHGATVKSPAQVVSSLRGRFRFVEETATSRGLRTPQLGALHAVLAQHSLESPVPMTVVMPTGTGKTETMLAVFAHTPVKTVVIVPSDALRTQIADKFATFGVLAEVGAVTGAFRCPAVGVVKSALKTGQEVSEFLDRCNVVVATAAAVSGFSEEALGALVATCDRLVVDEAHHVAAKTWRAIADAFAEKSIVQFTATPFREDGEYLGGRVVYAYPLRLAQEKGYFAPINYRALTDLGQPDRTLAEAAIAQLRADLGQGLDHVLMARVSTKPRADEVLQIYSDLARDLNPLRIDSRLSARAQREAFTQISNRESRVIVCVDMLGEGFDLPALKLAAVHDPHKSLAVTLQFVGRFARVGGEELGEASVFVPRPPGEVDYRLRRLYGEDSDWNAVIRDLTEAEVGREEARSEFEAGFGALPSEVALRSIQPKMSTVVYRSDAIEWNPDAVYDLFDESQLLTRQIAINEPTRVVWFVTAEASPVKWGDFSTFTETVHHLYVAHCDQANGLLYINSSNNDSIHENLAKAVGGEGVTIVRGDVVYRILAPIRRRVPTNVGLLDAVNRNRRFSMHVGADVLEGFGPTAAQKAKTNIFAHGYGHEGRVSFGASRKGRIWSHRVANNIHDWVLWCQYVGSVVTDETISIESVMDGFIIPTAATERPPLVPLGVEWPYELVATTSETRVVKMVDDLASLLEVDLVLLTLDDTSPIRFEVRTDDWAAQYEMGFGVDKPTFTAVGTEATITTTKGEVALSQFMTDKGMTIFFEQEAVLSPDGYLIQPDRERPRFDIQRLEVADWTDIDLHKESQGPDRDTDSIQYRAIEILSGESEWDVIVDDDGRGEVADVVFLRRLDRVLHVLLVHCKFSAGDQPGARLADLYEVCGQATKSHKARSEIDLILRKLLKREQKRQQNGRTGFIKGDSQDLIALRNESRLLDVNVTVVLVQPGLARSAFNNPLAELLGCTDLYLGETYNSGFRVLCSA